MLAVTANTVDQASRILGAPLDLGCEIIPGSCLAKRGGGACGGDGGGEEAAAAEPQRRRRRRRRAAAVCLF